MKTITNGVIVKRVDNITAQEQVKKGWKYCPKSFWKDLFKFPPPLIRRSG